MQIGAVAKKVGLTPDAIRFYERSALLPTLPRTSGGFRQYAESDVETLGFIGRMQGLGFTLNEVRELLDLRRSDLQPCAPVRQRLKRKLVHVRKKLTCLQELERELVVTVRLCDRARRKHSAPCPLLAAGKTRDGEHSR
jgi:MerR family transcriptional regulator, copper efflux regulator